MAMVSTSLSSAVAVTDKSIVVASATSVAAGRKIIIDGEEMEVTKAYVVAATTVPVLRGRGGTATAAHVSGAIVTHGTAEDFGDRPAGAIVHFPPAGRVRSITGYGAAGAITLPNPGEDAVAIIYGTALAMTLASPDEAITGSILYIINATAAAHTVTHSAGFGGGTNASYDVLTFDGTGTNCVMAMACNGIWTLVGQVDGTLTEVAVSIA